MSLRTDGGRRMPVVLVETAGAVFAALSTTALLLHLGRGRTFFYDEWAFVLHRRSGVADALFAPHNGHLSVVPVVVYRVLFSGVGIDDYLPYRLVGIAFHLACVLLLWRYLRERSHPVVAGCGAVSVLLLGSAWQNLLWPFQIGFFGSIIGWLGALIAAERIGWKADAIVALGIILALASSGLGVPILAGVLIRLVLDPRQRSRTAVALAAAVPYAVWYVAYGESQAHLGNLRGVAGFTLAGYSAAVGAGANLTAQWGTFVAGGTIVWAASSIRGRALSTMARPIGAAVVGLSFWVLTCLARGHVETPTASRYLSLGFIAVLLVVVELGGKRLSTRVLVLVVVTTCLAVWSNSRVLRAGAAGLRETSDFVSAELRALEIARAAVGPSFKIDDQRAPQVLAGPYLASVDALGSPALPESRLREQPEAVRASVDGVLVRALRMGVGPAVSSALASCESSSSITVRPGSSVRLEASSQTSVRVRRFAAQTMTPLGDVPAGSYLIEVPEDASRSPWIVAVDEGAANVCG